MSTPPFSLVDKKNSLRSTPINSPPNAPYAITSPPTTTSTTNNTSYKNEISNNIDYNESIEADLSGCHSANGEVVENMASPYACCCCHCCLTSSSMRINATETSIPKCHGYRTNLHLYQQRHPCTVSYETNNSRSKRASTITTATSDTGFFSMDDLFPSRTPSPCFRNGYGTKSVIQQLPLSNDDSQLTSDDFESAQKRTSSITRSMQHHSIKEVLLPEQISPNDAWGSNQSRVMTETTTIVEDENAQLWQNEFLDLLSMVIQCSDSLECLTADCSRTEDKLKELKSLEKRILEDYETREKAYLKRLNECEQASNLQSRIIDDLVKLEHDLELQCELNTRQSQSDNKSPLLIHLPPTAEALHYKESHHKELPHLVRSQNSRLPLLSRYIDSSTPSSTTDIVHKARWQIGKWIGGSVGTGRIVHVCEEAYRGAEYIIAGSGTLETATIAILKRKGTRQLPYSTTRVTTATTTLINHPIKIDISAPANFHTLQRYHYFVHINHNDQSTLFQLLSTDAWMPDTESTRCQFSTCTMLFNLFQRRHHCRRCGILVCQKHSLNRLPLFSRQTHDNDEGFLGWYRVCDTCFYDLIIARGRTNTTVTTIAGHPLSAVDSAADLTEIPDKDDLSDIP